VKPEFREHIFDPYFSTKPDGVGLGLTIAGEIINEYYAGSLELIESGPLPGATFRLVPPSVLRSGYRTGEGRMGIAGALSSAH
jgi:C4-dicarboxylate-specific signal transduction histidine kinase